MSTRQNGPPPPATPRVSGSVRLLVNGKERKTLTAPVTMTVEIPDYFIASYSNASYNYEVEGVDKADVDGEEGTVKITITKLGAFDVKAVKKPSRPSGGGSSSGKFPLLRKGESRRTSTNRENGS